MKKQIRILSEKILKLKETINTEEATKTSFILPLFQILGYDIFNPQELAAEVISDIGSKKGEKVDYVLFKDKSPIIVVECKKWSEDLNSHINQLIRYYHTSKVKFGLLTNGIEYRFFTDLEQSNIMDQEPFFKFNILDFTENDLDTLILFSKNSFTEKNIISTAENLKYLSKIKNVILNELQNPSKEFSDLLIRKIYGGRITTKVFESYSSLINKALEELFPKESIEEEKGSSIITTDEELTFYNFIIKEFPEYTPQLSYKDFKGHFSVIINGSSRQCVAKAHFNGKKKYIVLFDGDNEIKKEYVELTSDDLALILKKIEQFNN